MLYYQKLLRRVVLPSLGNDRGNVFLAKLIINVFFFSKADLDRTSSRRALNESKTANDPCNANHGVVSK